MRNHRRHARGRIRTLVIGLLLVTFVAACMPMSIPVPLPPGLFVLSEGVTTPVLETPAATEEPVSEVTEAGINEATALTEVAVDGPPLLSHRLEGREACIDCHAVETGKAPAPANHATFTDDVCLFCHLPEEGDAAAPSLPEEAEPEFCLACHGPFEELMALTAGTIVDELGIEGNPHMYVPHGGDKFTACDTCHTVHPLPVSLVDEIPEANIQYCYAACHHEQTFEPCSACHAE